MTFLSGFFRLAHLALQNVNKDYVIFLYFRNFIGKSDQNPKTKKRMNETKVKMQTLLFFFLQTALDEIFKFCPKIMRFFFHLKQVKYMLQYGAETRLLVPKNTLIFGYN